MPQSSADQSSRSASASTPNIPPSPHRVSTGIAGLDQVLEGGLPTDRIYLIDGEPGTGKTTLALQFLLAGRDLGEPGLYVTLSETTSELRGVAESHGWSLDGVDVFELASNAGDYSEEYTLFHPAEVELQQTVGAVFEAVEANRAKRVVFDSLSEMRMLAHDPLRFRRQILALKQFFAGKECTVLVLDDKTGPEGDLQLQSIAHGVILLEHSTQHVGGACRRLQVKKLRGSSYSGGHHDFRILKGGLEVYPRLSNVRLASAETAREARDERLSSGSSELDMMLGGGISRATSLLVTGAAGTGKSVLSLQFAHAAVARGESASIYLFDERIATAMLRARGIGMELQADTESGRLGMRQIEPTEMTPGEFSALVVRDVAERKSRLVVIDSLNGLLQSMPRERYLAAHVHELLSYLTAQGVTVLLTLVQRGLFGGTVDEVADLSYLADTIVLLRYFEHAGAVRQAISVVKKRSGAHERTIRECRVGRGGLQLGGPLVEFRGVLTGVPEYLGEMEPLMHGDLPSELARRPAVSVEPGASSRSSLGSAAPPGP